MIDGAKALAAAVRLVFGDLVVIQRCQTHERRIVKNHLPARLRDDVDGRTRGAFADPDPDAGLRGPNASAELDRTHPNAAGSLREGLDELFTVRRLGIDGTLARRLTCTNMVDSMISICRTASRNVKRWRWCAAGLLEAERRFRRLRGHRQMPDLVTALARHAHTVTTMRH